MKLYELSEQMQGLQALIEEGEMDAQTLEDTLDGLSADLQEKGEGVMKYLANLSADIQAYADEIKRLTARKKVITNQHDSLKEYLRTNMIKAGITKIESPVFTASLRKPSKMAEVTNEQAIPTEYKTHVPESWKVDKAKILRELKTGADIPGAELVDAKQALTIK